MRRFVLAIAAACLAGAANGLVPAHGATVDTFTFTQGGWAAATLNQVFTPAAADPGAVLTGSFTGTVEPSGLIELSDLTAFSDVFSDTLHPNGVQVQNLEITSLFSFNTAGGNSSLTIAGYYLDTGQSCVGSAVAFDSNCTGYSDFAYAAGINGSLFSGPFFPRLVTFEQPIVTLVSSVTTSPTTVAAPELPSSVLFLSGLVGMLVFVRQAGSRRQAAA